ncbi:hypothetical protein C2845_PM12G10130 [Panicum miliaceum]|uniref:Uncharacterized protein n=1 Tax=Panicum miliaceum TaxID=4540 RepID=A0A3L6QIR9_PANMI|nr:hypothetical protein C2845_PM12G10130 [Panicum miliaceum]
MPEAQQAGSCQACVRSWNGGEAAARPTAGGGGRAGQEAARPEGKACRHGWKLAAPMPCAGTVGNGGEAAAALLPGSDPAGGHLPQPSPRPDLAAALADGATDAPAAVRRPCSSTARAGAGQGVAAARSATGAGEQQGGPQASR